MVTKLLSRVSLWRHPLAGTTAMSLGLKVASAGTTFALFALLPRILSIHDYGAFAFDFSVVSFLGIVATIGFHRSVLRSIPDLRTGGRSDVLVRCLAIGNEFLVGAGLLVTAALLLTAFGLGWLNSPLIIAATLIFPIAYSEFLAAALRAFGFLSWALAPKDVAWRGGGAAVGAVMLITHRQATLVDVFTFLSLWLFLLVTVQTVLMFRTARAAAAREGPTSGGEILSRRSLLVVSVPMWLATVLFNASQHIDVVVVGSFLPLATVGVYFAAARTANLLSFVVFAIDMVASPLMAQAHSSRDRAALQRVLVMSSSLLLVPTLLGFLAIVIFGREILGVFGADFVSGGPLLIAMSGTFLIAATCGPVESFMQMSGLEREYLYLVAGTYATGLVVMICLLPLVGLWGAFAGHFMSVAVRNLLAVVYARRRIGVDPSILNLFRRNLARRGAA